MAARNTFDRLHTKFALPAEAEMEMILICFDVTLMPTVNRVFLANANASCYAMGEKLADVLYNDSQIQAHNATFMRLTWNEASESVEEYAAKVRSLGENLNVSQYMLKAAFIQGLPKRFQALVFGDRGSFDAVVAYTTILVSSGLIKRSEVVREVSEATPEPNKQKRYTNRRLCYACGEAGHFARDEICPRYKDRKQSAEKPNSPKTDESKKEEGSAPAKKKE